MKTPSEKTRWEALAEMNRRHGFFVVIHAGELKTGTIITAIHKSDDPKPVRARIIGAATPELYAEQQALAGTETPRPLRVDPSNRFYRCITD